MAKKVMSPIEAKYNTITKVAFESATAVADGFELKLKGSDEYALVIVTNGDTTAKKITVKAPTNGSYAAADSDLELSLSAGENAVIRLESARYANNDGTIILIPESTNVKAVAIY